MNQQPLSLYEFNEMVSNAISTCLPRSYWVEAEVSELRESGGHCYLTLVQKDLFQTTPVARASAKCWRNSWGRVSAKFLRVTGQPLHPGMKILLLASADFHPAYGFSLIVSDIDPTFTVGDMARRRQEIIQQLKDEGIFDLQRELQLTLFPQRIAVISSETAAGYGDFCNQLLHNDYGFHFDITLFPAIMQGEQVEESICSALNSIYETMHSNHPSQFGGGDGVFDLVVIIRGGGAVADMSGFDTLLLGENVANFPIPIITGIGHDRDECVLDMVSHLRVKTPTAAAAFLVDRLVEVQQRIEDAETVIVNAVTGRLDRQRVLLEMLVGKVTSHCRLLKQNGNTELMRMQMRLTNSVQQRLLREQHRLELLQQRTEALDPVLLLKRGYSMTTVNGRIVKSASQLHPGDVIETRLAEGRVESVVK